ncbi:Asp-tRNA(Asn)/Glu-tRNA(Gln) amidotransferase GatCAB subunit C [bacterium]|nr:Asp-tRNA(Asn)/Glu-tRNA(Gln) amidotransferase GatCAB subunit C [bacterium]
MLSEDDVKHIAKLARLKLSDEEIKKFSGQLSGIFKYVEQLDEVNTDGLEETSQVTGLKNVTQADEISTKCDGNALLLCSPLPKERKQILVKSVIKTE